jgi:hypothetical protein
MSIQIPKITSEYAKFIMINLCPFGSLHNKSTISKIENYLENFYTCYKEGNYEIVINENIHKYIYQDEDVHFFEEDDLDLSYHLIELCQILNGDDTKDQEELTDFYNGYHDMIKDYTSVFEKLYRYIYGFIYLRDKDINFDIFERSDYIIDGDIEDFYKHSHEIDLVDYYEFNSVYLIRDGTKSKIDLQNIDKLSLKENDLFSIWTKNDVVNLIVSKDKKLTGFSLSRVDPLKIIKFAMNDESLLGEVIHLYDKDVIKKLKPFQKDRIENCILESKQKIKEGLKEIKNISDDIREFIINKLLLPNLKEEENKMIKSSEKYYNDLNEKLKGTGNFEERKIEIVKFIQTMLENMDQVSTVFTDKLERKKTKLKISSLIYIFLDTDYGKEFVNTFPTFKNTVENKRQELLKDAHPIKDKWYIDILTKI